MGMDSMPRGKSARYPLAMPQTRSGSCGEEESFLPFRKLNPDPSDFQPLSIRYRDLTIPAPHIIKVNEEELEFYQHLFMTNINSISEIWDFHGSVY
jgi:hypothetical protein